MDIVYTPWRMEYIQSKEREEGCIFCNAFESEPSMTNLVVYRTDDLAVMLNRYPYTNGHMLVIPRLHIDSMTGLPAEFRRSCMDALVICEMILRKDFMAQGVNVGLNLGEAAGAGIADHLHFHILPRWYGDTNFSTVVGRLRVVPETLEESFERIFESFKQYK